jgi:hypothetical protein
MTIAATINPTLSGVPWFKGPYIGYLEWRKCARRIWEWLKHPRFHGASEFKFTDGELAQELGVSRRTVQYGLWWLKQLGVIQTWWQYGPKGGRIIEILITLASATPKPKPAPNAAAGTSPAPSPTPTTSRPKTGPAPGPPSKPATPEQLAAAAAQIARDNAPQQEVPYEELSPEDQKNVDFFRERQRIVREALAKKEAERLAKIKAEADPRPTRKLTKEEMLAALDARSQAHRNTPPNDGTPPQPSGP